MTFTADAAVGVVDAVVADVAVAADAAVDGPRLVEGWPSSRSSPRRLTGPGLSSSILDARGNKIALVGGPVDCARRPDLDTVNTLRPGKPNSDVGFVGVAGGAVGGCAATEVENPVTVGCFGNPLTVVCAGSVGIPGAPITM